MRAAMTHHEMDCTESPVKDYIDSVWKLSTRQLLRWYLVAVGVQDTVDLQRKDNLLVERATPIGGCRWEIMKDLIC